MIEYSHDYSTTNSIVKDNISNGQLLEFEYQNTDGKQSKRLVYVLERNADGYMHAIDLKYIRPKEVYEFIERAVNHEDLLDDPQIFYEQVVKKYNFKQNAYRTFKMGRARKFRDVDYQIPERIVD